MLNNGQTYFKNIVMCVEIKWFMSVLDKKVNKNIPGGMEV